MPRFLEVIIPIAILAGTLFTYNKLTLESEVAVMRAAGKSPINLAKPALVLASLCALLMLWITTWAAPTALSNMQELRQVIKAQYSTALFREGVFNTLKNGLTVYVKNRSGAEMHGLLIHDARPENKVPVLITANKGLAQATQDGQRILISEGTRQSFNADTGILSRLDFNQYSLDIPDTTGDINQRWREPDERTFFELLNPDILDHADRKNLNAFKTEAHRRILNPLLVLSFTLVGLCCLVIGPIDRRGQTKRIVLAIGIVVVLQSLFLATFNLALQSSLGFIFMYMVVFFPIIIGFMVLMPSTNEMISSWFVKNFAGQKS